MSKSSKLLALMGMGLALAGESGREFDDYVPSKLGYSSSPFFIPRKHTKMSYAKQNRLAKKRRNKSMYSK
jgi:hypothetical protein